MNQHTYIIHTCRSRPERPRPLPMFPSLSRSNARIRGAGVFNISRFGSHPHHISLMDADSALSESCHNSGQTDHSDAHPGRLGYRFDLALPRFPNLMSESLSCARAPFGLFVPPRAPGSLVIPQTACQLLSKG